MIKKLLIASLAITIAVTLLIGSVTVFSAPALAAQPVPASPMASSPSYQLNWDVVSSGGATMQSTSFTMHSTTGQNVTTTMTGSTYTMENGFWHSVFENIFKMFLPLIAKG